MSLSNKHRAFVDEYLQCWNATEAYARVYKPKKRTTAGANGHELLKNTEISAEIEQRLAEIHMSANEALQLHSDIARGDIGDFVNDFGMLDITEARKQGKTRLIKKIKQRTITKIGKSESEDDTEIHDLEIELYPADAAQDRILRVHGTYKDTLNINVNSYEIDIDDEE